jgi:hypothetical protein
MTEEPRWVTEGRKRVAIAKATTDIRVGSCIHLVEMALANRDRLIANRDRLIAELNNEREAREKCQAALRSKDAAMGVLFDRLTKAGVDCSDFIS